MKHHQGIVGKKSDRQTGQFSKEAASLQIFEHKDFGKVRTVIIDGEPWFVAKDVTQALGYKNSPDALKKHVDAEDRRVLQKSQNATFDIPTRGFAIINESGLYCLALSSKLPQAKAFRRWLTAVVIPSIRKHGAYATPDTLDKMMCSPQFAEALIDALAEEHSKNVALENKLEELTPRAHYCDVVLLSGDAIPISVIAKDYGLTAMFLNSLLHDLGIQYKVGGTWVLYQSYANKGYMKTRTFYKLSGDSIIHGYWTQRGRQFLYDVLALVGMLPLAELEEMVDKAATAKHEFVTGCTDCLTCGECD